MSTTILSYPARGGSGGLEITGRTVVTVLIAWLALVVLLGASGHFVSPPRIPPWPIALGAGLPLVAFFALLRYSRAFRAFVLALDLRFVAAVQAWRWAGLEFLTLYTYGILPGVFAWPAGLGDMIVGFSAPAVVLALARNPAFAGSRAFARWNVFGILDLAVALCVGTLASLRASGATGEVTTAPMAYMPLVLIPAFLVPFFIMLHAAALLQGRQVRAGGGGAP